jgi:hypothetical protein|tara:strand:+ start:7184 stop:7477 length:294 start_codon:yes stop_codon:yes gene_type:complete
MAVIKQDGNEIIFENGMIVAHHSNEVDNWVLNFYASDAKKMSGLWKEFRQYAKQVGWNDHTILIGKGRWLVDKSVIPYVVIRCTVQNCTHCASAKYI